MVGIGQQDCLRSSGKNVTALAEQIIGTELKKSLWGRKNYKRLSNIVKRFYLEF